VNGPMPVGKHILIVEDDRDVADVVVDALEREGYSCSIVADGREALQHIRSMAPDLIILDRGLPEYSGDEALRELKRDPALVRIPVILLTGKADESDQLVGFALGADDYICKPFSTKVLLARVDSLLRRLQAATAPVTVPETSVPAADITLDRMQFKACVGEQAVALSKIEYRILATLMAARGHVLDAKTLLGLAIGKKSDLSGMSIEPHIVALQKKLGPASRCIQEVHGAGYAFFMPDNQTAGR
jgi:two-component system, OmpR family, phosphate regulon response regulator PhoB